MERREEKRISDSNQGFSLIELVIVIAIMAILTGIIAIAVVPYLEKSREVKDLRQLDNICQGLALSVTNAGVQMGGGSGTFEATEITAEKTDPVIRGTYEQLGDCSGIKLTSAVGSPCKIICKYDIYSNNVEVYAENGGSVPQCTYLKNSKGRAAELKVLSTGGNNAFD